MVRWLPLVALLCVAPARCETPWPLRTTADLKALHGPTFAGMQILTFRHSQEPKVEGAAAQTIIGIGPDIIFREEGQARRVIDLRLGRIYDVQGARFTDIPIAANVVALDTELANRVVLSKGLAAAGIDQNKVSELADPFWRAVELKVTAADDPPPAVTTRRAGAETLSIYKESEVVRWQPIDTPLPAPVAAKLGRALLWFFPVHPGLVAPLSADGKAPQHLTLHWRNAGKLRTDEYQLVGSQWCATCQALPADAQPGLFVGGVFEKDMAPVMIGASRGKFSPTSSEEYLRRIDAALDKGATLDAWLWFIERLLQDGVRKCRPDEADDYCRIQNRLVAKAGSDADVRVFQQAMTRQSTESARAIAGLRDKAGSNAYYVDLATVNAMPVAGFSFKSVDQEPLKSAELFMASALAGMPMVPAVYRDIGNMYFNAIDVRRAWLAWEMGKAVRGRSIEPNLWVNVDATEARARQRHPEFF